MKNLTLAQRLTLIFALLIVIGCAFSGWMQVRSSTQYSRAVIQRLSGNRRSILPTATRCWGERAGSAGGAYPVRSADGGESQR